MGGVAAAAVHVSEEGLAERAQERDRMTITLELEPEIEARLRENAARAGMNETEYARRLLEDLLDERSMTGAEALAYWERMGVRGVFADRPDSPEFARQLRDQEEALTLRARAEGAEDDS
jgi:hypothetical protein